MRPTVPAPRRSVSVSHTITVADLLDLPTLSATTVVAGATGLDRAVRNVGIVAGTEVTQWVKSGAMLLSTAHPLKDQITALPQIVNELHERAVACLAVRLGSYLTEFPVALLKAADQVGLPVIRLTDQFAFDDILIDVLSKVNMALRADIDFADRVHTSLVEIVMSGGSVAMVADQVERLLSTDVVIFDASGQPMAPREDVPAAPTDWRLLDEAVREIGAPATPTERIVLRLGSPHNPLGYLQCWRPEVPFGPTEIRAVEKAATVAALALVQKHAVREMETGYQGDILGRVLRGELTDETEIAARFRDLGWQADGPLLVATVGVWPQDRDQAAGALAWLRSVGLPIVRQELGQQCKGAAAALVGRDLVIIGPARSSEGITLALHRVAATFDRRAAEDLGARLTVGISAAVTELALLRRGFAQAEVAAAAALRRNIERRICRFDDLGVLGLVLATSRDSDLTQLRADPLGALDQLTRRGGPELMNTLRTVMENNLNLAESARLLHCHYNTVRQRVRRLEELLGPFLSDPDIRLEIALAFRLRDFAHDR
jgi:purine catabolism regulator